MVTSEQLETCKKCSNQRLDANGEIICRYTNKAPDFRGKCIFFENASGSEDESAFDEFEKTMCESAGQGQRFANYMIDLIAFYIFIIIAGGIIGVIVAILNPSAIEDFKDGGMLLNYLIGFIGGVIYYTLIEFVTGGRSLGKVITKTKVITLEGDKPDFKAFLIRALCRFIPLESFSFLGSADAGWHDSISRTRVVRI
jgi:uncharacterized RDD family membrane protein YckC